MHAKKKNPHKIIFSHGTLGFFSMILPEKAIVYNAQFLVTHGKIHREMLIILSKEERSNIGSQVFIFYLNDLSFDYIKIVNYLVAAQNLGDVKGILDFKPPMIFLKYINPCYFSLFMIVLNQMSSSECRDVVKKKPFLKRLNLARRRV